MPYRFDTVKLLIVDDMAPMLDLMKTSLDIMGFKQILTAKNGEEAFRLICDHDPDLILTDWVMEPMDGLQLAQKIRRDPMSPNPYVPIIMMTGFSSRLRVEASRDHGITEFMVKPFTARDLYTRIHQIIEKPRQFVDASEFFGPDRRRKIAKDYVGARRRGADEKQKPSTPEEKEASSLLSQLRNEAKKV